MSGLVGLFVLGLVLGATAIVLGVASRGAIRRSGGRLRGEGLATGAIVLGAVGIVGTLLALL